LQRLDLKLFLFKDIAGLPRGERGAATSGTALGKNNPSGLVVKNNNLALVGI